MSDASNVASEDGDPAQGNEGEAELESEAIPPPIRFMPTNIPTGWLTPIEAAFSATGRGQEYLSELSLDTDRPASIEQCVEWMDACSWQQDDCKTLNRPIEIFRDLMLFIKGPAALHVVRRAYRPDSNDIDPRRTLVRQEETLRIARFRLIAVVPPSDTATDEAPSSNSNRGPSEKVTKRKKPHQADLNAKMLEFAERAYDGGRGVKVTEESACQECKRFFGELKPTSRQLDCAFASLPRECKRERGDYVKRLSGSK